MLCSVISFTSCCNIVTFFLGKGFRVPQQPVSVTFALFFFSPLPKPAPISGGAPVIAVLAVSFVSLMPSRLRIWKLVGAAE